jgi:hypothetical protein
MGVRKPIGRPADAQRESTAAPGAGPNLPAWKAFVVQFTIDSGPPSGETFAGRVEHLASGRRVRFATARELVDCLRGLLDQTDE